MSRHPLLQARRDLVVGLQIVAGDLRVDRRRQAEVQHLADDIGGLEVDCGHCGNFAASASRIRSW